MTTNATDSIHTQRRLLFVAAGISALGLSYLYNFLLFHTLAELVSIIIMLSIFLIVWNTRQLLSNDFFLFLGISFSFVAGFDLLHALAYRGLNIFEAFDANLPTQLWIIARYMQSISLLVATLIMGRKVSLHYTLAGYAVITGILLLSLFYWRIFPDCYIEGRGLTPFKIASEYLICGILLLSVGLLWQRRAALDQKYVLYQLIAAIIFMIFSELAFTLYTDVDDIKNVVGHLLKVLSIYFVYIAFVETALTRPYSLLFREMKQNELALKESQDHLEDLVEQRTASLQQEINTRKQAERSLAIQNRYQRILSQLGFEALQAHDLQAFMDIFVERVRSNLDVEYCKILELQRGEDHFLVRAGAGWQDGVVGVAHVEASEQTHAGYTLTMQDAVIMRDLATEKRFKGAKILSDHDVVSGMSVIIHTRDKPYGVLTVHTKHARHFSENDVQFLENVASLLSAVIERYHAEEEALRERNLLRLLMDNIPDYIVVKDANERIIEANEPFARLAGLTREQVLGQTARDVFDPHVATQYHADDHLILKHGKMFINEERKIVTHDGQQSWGLVTKLPLKNADGHITGLIGIVRDITDRIEAEARHLESEKVRIEIEEQRKLVELKERFIATASHDFRTPLSIIQSSTDLLQTYMNQLTPQQQRERLARIQAQVHHMTRLLDDVLTISKSHAHRVQMNPSPIDLKTFCEEIWSNIVSLDSGAHLKEMNYRATIDQFIGDPQLLRQVFDNLLNNALKYTPDGKLIKFDITNDADFLYFEISDQGYGIPTNDIDRLFEPFHRAKNVTNIKGTGLGLTIVKDFIALHNGNIEVCSDEGEGSTFIVRLPISETRP